MKLLSPILTYLLMNVLAKSSSGQIASNHLRYKSDSEDIFPLDQRRLQKEYNSNPPPFCAAPSIILPGLDVGEDAASCVSLNKTSSYGCSANDLQYLSCSLVKADRSCFTDCNAGCGQEALVNLECTVLSTGASGRTITWVLAELLTTGSPACNSITDSSCTVAFCVSGVQAPGGLLQGVPTKVLFPQSFPYKCGSTLAFKSNLVTFGGLILGSAAQSVTTCGGAFGTQSTCKGALTSKCSAPLSTVPINPPLAPPTIQLACFADGSRNVNMTYSIIGGQGPYSVSVKCSTEGGAARTLTTANTKPSGPPFTTSGVYSYAGPDCQGGSFSVTITDSSRNGQNQTCAGLTASKTDPGCCIVSIACLPNAGPFTVEGCSAGAFPATKNSDLVFNKAAAESCGKTFVYETNVTNTGTWCNSATPLKRTYNYRALIDGALVKTCSQDVVVSITVPPTINDLAVNEECGTPFGTGKPAASDSCSNTLTAAFVSSSTPINTLTTTPKTCGTDDKVQQIVEVYRATDACGNSKTATKTINVFDTTKPNSGSIACNNLNKALTCTDTTIPSVNPCTITDSCFGPLTGVLSCSTSTGAYVREWTFTDPCGNVADTKPKATYDFGQVI